MFPLQEQYLTGNLEISSEEEVQSVLDWFKHSLVIPVFLHPEADLFLTRWLKILKPDQSLSTALLDPSKSQSQSVLELRHNVGYFRNKQV